MDPRLLSYIDNTPITEDLDGDGFKEIISQPVTPRSLL
jgi:hypothetical protein